MGSTLRRASATLFLPSEGMSGSVGWACVPARRPCYENYTRGSTIMGEVWILHLMGPNTHGQFLVHVDFPKF
jgi:hypothetical protein